MNELVEARYERDVAEAYARWFAAEAKHYRGLWLAATDQDWKGLYFRSLDRNVFLAVQQEESVRRVRFLEGRLEKVLAVVYDDGMSPLVKVQEVRKVLDGV